MALKKPTPAFETEPGTTVADAPAAAPAAPVATVSQPVAAVEATTAIAKAGASSGATMSEAAAQAKRFKIEVEAMRGAADFSYGAHRVFKAKDGVIRESAGAKVVLGKWVKVRLLAWDNHFEVSPGEEGKGSSDFVGYSKDGITIDSVIGAELKGWEGKPTNAYVEHLRVTEEFDKVSKREFVDCQVATLGSEEEPDFNEVVQITLSSSSISSFKNYQSKLEGNAKAVAMGLPGYALPEDPFQFYFIREAAEKGKNTWTKLRIATVLPSKV